MQADLRKPVALSKFFCCIIVITGAGSSRPDQQKEPMMNIFDLETSAVKKAIGESWNGWARSQTYQTRSKPSFVFRLYASMHQARRGALKSGIDQRLIDDLERLRIDLGSCIQEGLRTRVLDALRNTTEPVFSHDSFESYLAHVKGAIAREGFSFVQ